MKKSKKIVPRNNVLILHIETSARTCSVALSTGPVVIHYEVRQSEKFIHAESLHVMIVAALRTISPKLPAAVHVCSGPGSYTGLRIGMSAAKGLAFAWGVPMMSISAFELAMGQALEHSPGATGYLATIDAGREEVYAQLFSADGLVASEPMSDDVHSAELMAQLSSGMVICGSGAGKFDPSMLPADVVVASSECDAQQMNCLGYAHYLAGHFADLAYCEPLYVKPYVPGKPKKTSL